MVYIIAKSIPNQLAHNTTYFSS